MQQERRQALRERVLSEIAHTKGHIELAKQLKGDDAKQQLRRAHADQRMSVLADAAQFVYDKESFLLQHFADGDEVDPAAIDPVLIPVRTDADADLFRYASLTWSVPVSSGYGRRSRFLVRDRQNDKLIAIFALGDPVIGQRARDSVIGWTTEQRNRRLYNVYDAYVLGAVEPYRQLLGGKLVALLTLANETREFLFRKYQGSTTTIRAEQKDPTPALITTSSALGRSSVYNRITYRGRTAFHSVGFTQGFGHFQFSQALFQELREFVRDTAEADETQAGRDQANRYGAGPNWRFRVIRNALDLLGIDQDMLQHDIRREVFLAPAAANWDSFLRGETDTVEPLDMPAHEIGAYYRERWAIGRAERRPEFRYWRREQLRLSDHLDVQPRQLTLSDRDYSPPGYVELGAYRINIGTDGVRLRERTPSGRVGQGLATICILTGPGMAMRFADITWADGHREVRGLDHLESDAIFASLVGKHRLVFRPAPLFSNMIAADVRVPFAADGSEVTLHKTSADQLRDITGLDVAASLDRAFEATVGERALVLRDSGPRRRELCVVLPATDRVAPAVVWALARPIALGRLLNADLPSPQEPKVIREPPNVEYRDDDSASAS